MAQRERRGKHAKSSNNPADYSRSLYGTSQQSPSSQQQVRQTPNSRAQRRATTRSVPDVPPIQPSGQTQAMPSAGAAQMRSDAAARNAYPAAGATAAFAPVGGGAERAAFPGQAQHRHAGFANMPSQKGRAGKSAAKVVFGIILIVLLAAAAYGIWFVMSLNGALDKSTDTQVADALVPSNGNPYYTLVIGSDWREYSGTSRYQVNQGDNERSDVMMLLRIDEKNKQLTMLSIPRDTPYTWPDGSVTKINEVYNREGAQGTVRAVSELVGKPISHYAELHFSDFEKIVDTLGGVTVNVDTEMTYMDALTGEYITLKPGTQVLDGQQAQIYARSRKVYDENQDEHRQSNVRGLALAIIKSVLAKPPAEIPGTVIELAKYVNTDMRAGDFIPLAIAFSAGGKDMVVYSGTGPSNGDVNPAADNMWMCFENPEGWKKIMDIVDSGGNPHGVDVSGTQIPWQQ